MTPTKPTQLKHYVDVTTKQYLYHIKIFTSVPYKTLFSHVKKTSLNFYKSLSFIASYICICVVIKAIILGHDLLICQSQPSRVCLLMSHSGSHPHLSKRRVPFSCCCFSVSAPLVLRMTGRNVLLAFCNFPEMCGVILPPLVTGSTWKTSTSRRSSELGDNHSPLERKKKHLCTKSSGQERKLLANSFPKEFPRQSHFCYSFPSASV